MRKSSAKKSLAEGYQFLKHINRRLPMPNVQQDPQQELLKLFNFTKWLGIAALVLLILLIATLIAPFVHFGADSDTEKIMSKLNEFEKLIQAKPASGLTAQHLDKQLESLKCVVRKQRRDTSSPKNGDTAKIVTAIEELTVSLQSIPPGGLTANQLHKKLNQMKSKLGAIKKLVQ